MLMDGHATDDELEEGQWWDYIDYEITPQKSGTIRVTFEYIGRSKPFPEVNDD